MRVPAVDASVDIGTREGGTLGNGRDGRAVEGCAVYMQFCWGTGHFIYTRDLPDVRAERHVRGVESNAEIDSQSGKLP